MSDLKQENKIVGFQKYHHIRNNTNGDVPLNIIDTIEEWTEEGHQYLYEQNLERIKELEQFLKQQNINIDESGLYRRTDWDPLMKAKAGDIIDIVRLTSWSLNENLPDTVYQDCKSVKLIIENQTIAGIEVSIISAYPKEQEVMVSPCKIRVNERNDDFLKVSYIGAI